MLNSVIPRLSDFYNQTGLHTPSLTNMLPFVRILAVSQHDVVVTSQVPSLYMWSIAEHEEITISPAIVQVWSKHYYNAVHLCAYVLPKPHPHNLVETMARQALTK